MSPETPNTIVRDPVSVVTAVEIDRRGFVTIQRSCGHPAGYAGHRIPEVGEQQDCLTCWLDAATQRARERRNARRRALYAQRKAAVA